jgi:uncharacterized protein YraI
MNYFRRVGSVFFILAALLALLVVFPVKADYGINWSATFFNDNVLGSRTGGTSVTIAVPTGINFNWGTGSVSQSGVALTNCLDAQVSGGGTSADCSNYFSARFTSTQAVTPGTYNFVVSSDDGVRVYINGNLRLDKWVGRPATTDQFTEVITTSPVMITVEYFENTEGASVQVQWFLQGGVGTAFPTITPIATTVPFTVQVQNVRGLSIRTGPYLGASFVGAIVPGTAYSPSARNNDEGGGYTWYYITAGDKSGWVSGRYLQITGDPNSVPVQGTVFDQIDNAASVGAYAAPRSVMNFRRRPSQRAAMLGQIPWGANLELVGRTIQGGKNFWLQVRYEGQVGWIFAPFVSVSGNLDAVPIR